MPEKHTPDSVMLKLKACETEVGQQLEAMRIEFEERHNSLTQDLDDHQSIVSEMKEDWDKFIKDFYEMLSIFRTFKGFIRFSGWIGIALKWAAVSGAAYAAIYMFLKTGHWPGLGE